MKPIINFKKYLKEKKITYKQADEDLGFSAGYVSKQITAEAAIGADFLNKIVKKYTDLNVVYLIMGTGEMFEKEDKKLQRDFINTLIEEKEKLQMENAFLHEYVKSLQKQVKELGGVLK